MVMTLARIREGKYSQPSAAMYSTDALAARSVCLVVRLRLKELAKTDKRLVGVLSIEILLIICVPVNKVGKTFSDLCSLLMFYI